MCSSDLFAIGTKEFNARVNDIVLDPTPERAAVLQATGDYNTFTQKLGARGRALQLVVKDSPLEFIAPFIKTPVNLMKFSAGYMPGFNLLLRSAREDLAAGGVRRDRVVARMAIGAVIGSSVIAGVGMGTVTGGGYQLDKEGKAARLASGWQPYSIKIDGKW